MLAITDRIYSGIGDWQGLIDLLTRVRPLERITDYPGVVDLRELLCLPAVQVNTRLWFDEKGRIAAFAMVDSCNNLLFEIEPAVATAELEAAIVDWGVKCVRREAPGGEEDLTLDASCRGDDDERVSLLARYGFILQPVRSLRLLRSLNDPIPAPVLPAGFQIRPLMGRDEAEMWVILHRAAFGTGHMTVEEKLAMMGGPDYDPQFDLVAVAPDDRLAAYCVCGIDQTENALTGRNEGYTDPVATHPEFQNRGLAKALLLTGLRLLKARGVQTVVMGTGSENKKMQRTAQAVGFYVESAKIWFAKPV